MNTNIRIPIGLKAGVEAVQKICSYSRIYYRCGLRPPHYIVNIDAGNGQTTFTEYVAEAFCDNGVRHFGGLDNYLEFTLDGSMSQLKNLFAKIRTCAVYTNEFEGIVAMDIAKLSTHINEAQVEYFISGITDLSNHATFIFYVPSVMNRNIATLVSKIAGVLSEVEVLNIQPYNDEEMMRITKVMMEDAGVKIEDNDIVDNILLELVIADEINTVKAAKKLSQEIIKRANFDGFIPKITANEIRNVYLTVIPAKKEVK